MDGLSITTAVSAAADDGDVRKGERERERPDLVSNFGVVEGRGVSAPPRSSTLIHYQSFLITKRTCQQHKKFPKVFRSLKS